MDLNPSQGLSNASAPTPDHNSFFTDSRASHPVSSSSKFPFTNPDMSTLVPSIGNFNSGNMIAPSRPTSGKATGLPTQPELEWDNNPAQLELASSARSKPEPKLASPSVSTRSQKPKVTTPASSSGGVSFGSRTRKLNRVGKMLLHGSSSLPGEEFNLAFLDLPEPCTVVSCHEGLCGRNLDDSFKQYELIGFKKSVIEWIRANENDLTNGGVCFLLHMENTFLCEDKEDLEYLNQLRKDRGFNRDYGTPDFEHCDFDTIECKKDTHENCICSKLFQNRGHCATCYKNWLERIVIVSTFHPLARAQTRRLQKVARKNLRGNVFARQLQYTSPRTIFGQADLTPLNVIGPNLEYIRKELGVVDVEDPWFAQADVDDTPDPGTWMSYFGLDGLSDSLKESYDVCVKAVKDMFKKCIDSIVGSLSWLKKLLTDLYDRVASLIIDSFFKPIKDYFSQIGKVSLIAFVTLVLILILVTMGLFTWEKISQFLGYVVDSTASISVQVCSILSSIFKVELSDLLRYCKNMVLLTAGFSVTVTAGAKIFSMLPYGIRATMIAKFGTQSAKTNLLIDEWKARALTVLAMTRVPRVVSSDFYTEKLNEVQLEGFKFIKDLEPNRRMDILNIYNRINQAWSNVLAKVEAERSRCIPFSIHLAGPPGVGKTTLTKKLLYTLGYNETDTYHRPPCTEYWDGFVSAKVVIYDEFLINTETATTTATEYLNLVSSAPFRPPLASTDNISVGIKGIAANPEMVLTMNNSTHSVPSSLTSHAAFLRRRNMVLELDYDPDFCRAHNIQTSGNVPMRLLTGKERSDMAWIRTRFHDSKTNQQKSGWMTLARALELIKMGFDEHRKWFGVVQDERPDLGPCEYFEEILKLHYGVPTQTFSAWDFIKTTFSGIFSSNSEQTELKEVFTANGEVFRAQGKKGTKKRVKTALKEEGYHVMWVNKNGRSAGTLLNCTMNKDFGTYLHSILSGSGYDPKFGFRCNGTWYMMPESTKEIADFRLQPEYEMKELFANHPHAHTMKVVNFEHLPDAKPTGIDLIDLSEPSLEPEPKDEPESPGHDEVDIPELPTVPPPESEPETPDDDETDSSSSIADADYQSSPEEPDQFAQDIEDRLAALMVPGEELDFATQMGILDHLTKAASSVYRWAKECGLWFLRAILPEDNFICWMVFFIMLWFIFIGYLVWKGNEAVIDLMESEATFYRTMKMEGQSDTSKKETSNKRTRKIQKASKKDWESQGQTSMLGSITVVSGNSSSSQHCVSIGSRYILTTAHLWDYPTEVMRVTVSLNNQVYNFDLTSEQIALDVQNDIGLFRVPSIEFPNSKSMDNKFAFFNEICNIGTIQVTIQKAKENVYATSRLLPGWTYSSMSTTHQPERMFVYNARFENGDCGSIIRSADTIAAGKILAIHCCGNTSLSNPKGGATVVCFEDLQALKKELEGDVQLEAFEAVANGNVCEIEPWDEEDSNILDIRPLPRNDAVFFPTRTKISTSLLYGRVDHDSVKQPSVMKDNDPRTCRQPSENFIERLKILNNSKIDYDLLDSIKSTMVKNWKRDVNDLYRVRELTIEEAIGGIPNYLSSLKVKTSPGYPVCKMMDAKGKRACFEFNDNILKIEPWFKQAVKNRLLQMKAGECPDNRFIVFFKDELVSPSKVEEARTRAIYCNDVISLVAFRIRYGMTLARINNSSLTTPSAIGLNQYSTDMHSVFTYLTATGNKNFVAGDYKNFDLSYHRDFQRAAYDVFFALNPITTEEENHYLWQHEAEVPLLQFKDKLIRVGCMHTSGCFLTSVINCFVNEMYFRYIFSLAYPQKVFDKECRLKVLGDDHILTVSDRVDFKPFKIRELMLQIGQTYTSDQKNQELEDRYRQFSEITFLGAHPRLVRVNSSMLYVGAPKQEQLWQTIQWTRTKNADLDTVVESCIYLASLWDQNFFDLFLSTVQKAYFEIGRDFVISIPSYQECQRIAANRNAASGEDWFRAQGRVGLTQIIDENVQQPSENSSVGLVFGNDGIQEQPGSLDLGTDSLVHREDIKWTVNDGKNTIIYEMPCPFGIMAKGQDENLQNMPFIRYLYTRCDVEVVIQIAGTPFHQGALIAVLTPLRALDKLIDNTFGYRYEVPVPAMPFYNHVILSPNCSTTATLKQPFIWFRDWLSTSAKENYCRLHIGVLSPLLTGTDGSSSISLSIFSRFPNLKVVIPRPLDRTNTARDLTHDGLDRPACPTDDGNPDHWTAQGNHVSTSNNYNISNVAGSVPVGTSNQTSATDSTDLKLQANPNISALPMDNPPMCSGAIPTYPVFPSRSKTVGITTAVSMSHHPEEMHRQPHQQSAESMDMSVEKYCNRPTILGSFQWTPTSSVSDVLMSIPLNSTLFWPAKYEPGTPHWMPSCCFPLNLAQFWRADFEFTFVCVMTDFHSGRLRATVAYGCDPYNTLHNSIYRNEIMDFTSGSEVSTVLVPYNAPTEFLQSVSYMGSDRNLELEMMQEMGSLQVTVANALQCPPSVAQTVEVLVFVTARNVQLREVKPYNVVRPGYKITYKRENFVAQGLVSTTVEKGKEKVEETTSTLAVVVDDFSSKDVPDPCRLSLNSKFEYTWNNFGEIFRRYVRVAIAEYRIGNNVSFCPVFPNLWREMFTVWAGHIQLRLLVSSSNGMPPEVGLNFMQGQGFSSSITTGSVNLRTSAAIYEDGNGEDWRYQPNFYDSNCYNPVEHLYPINSNSYYIDLRVPFNSMFNFLPFSGTSFYKLMPVPFSLTVTNCITLTVWMKASDDLRTFIARPVCNFDPIPAFASEGMGGFFR